jgi:hypothetical protein
VGGESEWIGGVGAGACAGWLWAGSGISVEDAVLGRGMLVVSKSWSEIR